MNETHNSSPADQLIAGFLSNKITDNELKELRQWLAESAEHVRYFEEQREIWFAAVAADPTLKFDSEKAFKSFRNSFMQQPTPSRQVFWKHPAFRVAASVAILVVFSVLVFQWGERSSSRYLSDVTIEAPQGSRTRLLLNDGSVVWLNAGSRLTYSSGFGVSDRDIHLEGEGYFEVRKNAELPFRVHSDELVVTVLGTKFNFCNFPDDDEASVALLEGKVSYTTGSDVQEKVLVPDQKVVLNKKSGLAQVVDVKANRSAEWTQGYLCFEDDLLTDIARRLERSYNVNIIIVDDTLDTYRFYGDFRRTEQSIGEVLEMLSSTNKLTYHIQGKDIYLHAR
jgi:ferric-dicitrate binding protein FerR (iron transport regulator)